MLGDLLPLLVACGGLHGARGQGLGEVDEAVASHDLLDARRGGERKPEPDASSAGPVLVHLVHNLHRAEKGDVSRVPQHSDAQDSDTPHSKVTAGPVLVHLAHNLHRAAQGTHFSAQGQ